MTAQYLRQNYTTVR